MNTENQIIEAIEKIRAQGYAVVFFTPQELHGADCVDVEKRLTELGVEVIDDLNSY